jgi:DNA-binding NarL/FixJ family response regulator
VKARSNKKSATVTDLQLVVSDPAAALRVWIVEDNPAYRNSLTRVVSRMAEVGECRVFGDCEDAMAALQSESTPDVMLLDLGLPGMSGAEGLIRFKSLAPNMRVIVLTSFDDQGWIFKAICAGASGYLLKSTPLSQITGAIRDVLNGGAPMTPQVASIVLNMFAQFGAVQKPNQEYGLSPRERQTLEGMVAGLTAKEIAGRMEVSYHTVDTYVRNIYLKMDVQSRGGAVAKAVREKLF